MTTVFQDRDQNVFVITDKVTPLKESVFYGNDILTLVDADGQNCEPHGSLLDTNEFRMLVTSSPRKETDRRWLKQNIRNSSAAIIMAPWSPEEFIIMSSVCFIRLNPPSLHYL